MKRCVGARAALAELKQAASLLPNPAILVNTLPLLEAQASSEIEHIVTTTDRLFRFAGGGNAADPPTKESLRYRHALLDGFATLPARPLCTATAELVCSRIKDTAVKVRRVPGTALANDATAEVIYTPPEGEDRIRGLLANWERFLHGEDGAGDIDPLVRMAVAHYQFEAIHPFSDGNGRTGRVLNSLFDQLWRRMSSINAGDTRKFVSRRRPILASRSTSFDSAAKVITPSVPVTKSPRSRHDRRLAFIDQNCVGGNLRRNRDGFCLSAAETNISNRDLWRNHSHPRWQLASP